jgi:hypothetical protein
MLSGELLELTRLNPDFNILDSPSADSLESVSLDKKRFRGIFILLCNHKLTCQKKEKWNQSRSHAHSTVTASLFAVIPASSFKQNTSVLLESISVHSYGRNE